MKKHILAAAVSAAVAVPAMAQNVSIYGILDASVINADRGGVTKTFMSSGLMSSSRLGLSGSEDLGQGMKAYFKLEGRLGFDTGTLGATTADATTGTTAAGNNIFNRDAFVGLSGGFGAVELGLAATDFNKAYAAGNVSGFNIGDSNAAFSSSAFSMGDRAGNTVRYTAPAMSGFTVSGSVIAGEYTTTTETSARDGYGLTLSYAAGPLKAAVARSERQAAAGVTTAPRDTLVAVSYDLGMAKVGFTQATGDKSKNSTNDKLKINSLIGVAPIGKGVDLIGAYHDVDGDSGANIAGNAKAYAFGVTKALSKRTTVYAAYATVNNDASSSVQIPGGLSVTAAGQDGSGYGVGVRHAF